MKKLKPHWLFIIIVFTACLYLCLSSSSFKKNLSKEDSSGLRWIREESFFVDYSITGNKISFRYSVCFENNYDRDISVGSIVASFSKSDLRGWLEYEKHFLGDELSDEGSIVIPSGEKVNVIFTFEGTYLGGEVNSNLKIKTFVSTTRIVREGSKSVFRPGYSYL